MKRSKLEDYKAEGYIAAERPTLATSKVNASGAWNDQEKSFLEDVTMNLVPDEEAVKNIKGTTAMRWDMKKKKYMLKKVDREGRVITERRNESGAKINSKDKNKESIFKKWQKKTHLSLQKAGDREDSKAIEQAKRANEARRSLKDFKSRHGATLFKGTDSRDTNSLVEKKKERMFKKAQMNKEKNVKGPMG